MLTVWLQLLLLGLVIVASTIGPALSPEKLLTVSIHVIKALDHSVSIL